ncbi:MAG: hypothetical protein AAF718_04280 [Pseudomonadota bacterium]
MTAASPILWLALALTATLVLGALFMAYQSPVLELYLTAWGLC